MSQTAQGTIAPTDAGDKSGKVTKTPRWLPLESNPEVLNLFLRRMGVSEEVEFVDVFGLDPDLLAFLPQPCYAICLLFPSKKISGARREEFKEICLPADSKESGIFYLHQHRQFGNACGTIAMVHALLNNLGDIDINADSPLMQLYSENQGKSADDIGWSLADMSSVHEATDESANTGQTSTPGRNDSVDSHFISFIQKNGHLIEMDGQMAGPIDHGPTNAETFVLDVAKVVQEQFMARDPESIGFNLTALCKRQQ